MRISELNQCLEQMRKIYNYDEKETAIRVGGGVNRNCVEIETADKGTGVMIHLTTAPEIQDTYCNS
jgi:hypothetical protein